MRLSSAARRLQHLAWRTRRRIRHRLAPPALILMYHRVAELTSDPQLLAVTPAHFAAHLEVLTRVAHVCSLQELVGSLRGGQMRRRAVAITLDDGYADNLVHAEPLLRSRAVPATVFVTAGFVDGRREAWWDELDRLLLQPGVLPPRLELQVRSRRYVWKLDSTATYTQDMYARHRTWDIERPDDPTLRHALYRSLYHLLHDLSPAERQPQLDALRSWAGAGDDGRASHRMLTADELVALSRSDVIEIGAHTMSHPVLPAQPVPEQRREIEEGKSRLEALIGRRVTAFAYPHGATSSHTAGLVRGAGFDNACSTSPDVVHADADLLNLPRLGVRDWDRATFARFLDYWLDG